MSRMDYLGTCWTKSVEEAGPLKNHALYRPTVLVSRFMGIQEKVEICLQNIHAHKTWTVQ